jgi:molybdopterin converting factor small subunit
MVTVTVRYLGILSQLAGRRKERVVLEEGTTVEGLVDVLLKRHGRELAGRLEPGGGMQEVVFAVRGEVADPSRVLEDDDDVVISYPVGGG